VDAVEQPEQEGRTNSVAPAVLGQVAGLVPALVELLMVTPAVALAQPTTVGLFGLGQYVLRLEVRLLQEAHCTAVGQAVHN